MPKVVKLFREPTIRVEWGRWVGYDRRYNLELSLYKHKAGVIDVGSGILIPTPPFKRPLIHFWKALDDFEMFPYDDDRLDRQHVILKEW